MSRFLVRKAFNLMEDDLKSHPEDSRTRHKTLKSKQQAREMGNSEIIEWNLENKVLSGNKRTKRNVDRTEENLNILKELSKLQPKRAAAQKVLEYHLKLQSKHQIVEEVVEPEPESILFPEENQKKKKRK